MKTHFRCKQMNNRGFTLIELLIVVAIMAILGAVATTAYIGVTKKAARSEAYSNLESLRLLEEQFFAENGAYTTSAATLADIQDPSRLPGFRPGPSLSYDYVITQNERITNNAGNTVANPPIFGALTPCFRATATGILGSRVCPDAANCDMFAIDCNNNRNF